MEAQNGEKNTAPEMEAQNVSPTPRQLRSEWMNVLPHSQMLLKVSNKTIRPQTTFQVTHHKSPSWGVSLPAPTDTEHVEFVCIRPFLLMNNINKVDSSRNPPFVHELRQNNMSYPKPAGSGELCSSWTLAQVEAKHLAAAAACSGMG